MLSRNHWLPILDYNHRPTNSPPITSYVNCTMVVIHVDTDKLAESTRPARNSHSHNSHSRPDHPIDLGSDTAVDLRFGTAVHWWYWHKNNLSVAPAISNSSPGCITFVYFKHD